MNDADVIVVGGGPAGIGAAFGAARQGARVLIVEQFNCLGGVATAGGHGHICGFTAKGTDTIVVGGVAEQVSRRVVDAGYGVRSPAALDFEIEGMKFVLERMAHERGVELLYHTFFCKAIVDAGRVTGVVVQSKAGRRELRAGRVVDCTGDGDVAASAGAPCETGRPGDGKCQPATLMFTIGGVDWGRVRAWRTDFRMEHVWKQAQDAGDMEPFQSQIMGWWWTPTRPDQVGVNFTHITGVDATSAEDLTRATIEGRRQAHHSIEVFRKYVPGMEHCYLVSTPNTVGLRESRRIVGDVVLTEDDLRARREWPDSIGYGSFFFDIHNLDGPGMSPQTERPGTGFRYQIPYRILLPQTADRLLVAGRCVSVTHVALGSIRVMPQCMVTGEAAGTAAALSLERNVTPRALAVPKLQKALRQSGAILDETDVERANAPAASPELSEA